jgi:hypothetical protein
MAKKALLGVGEEQGPVACPRGVCVRVCVWEKSEIKLGACCMCCTELLLIIPMHANFLAS